MNEKVLNRKEMEAALADIKNSAEQWLCGRLCEGEPFGRFSSCASSKVPFELNAVTAGMELWVMLGLPMSVTQKAEAVALLRSYQNADSGLVWDKTWDMRLPQMSGEEKESFSTFFTHTAACALMALGSNFEHIVRYVAELTPRQLIEKTEPLSGAHRPFSIGDYAALLHSNAALGDEGAKRQLTAVTDFLNRTQDEATGLWPVGSVTPPYTRYVNLAFHLTRTTFNMLGLPLQRSQKIIDSCLACAYDDDFYGVDTGYACNDLDLAVMLYRAAQFSNHRRDEVEKWARVRLPRILNVRKSDGGFSFFHDRAMEKHHILPMSDGNAESDIWGTLMYMGTVNMMARLGYEGLAVPWGFSVVHCV